MERLFLVLSLNKEYKGGQVKKSGHFEGSTQFHWYFQISTLIKYFLSSGVNNVKTVSRIDLFTDTAARLNLLDLRSIMGCPGDTRSVFTRAFRAKREL